MNKPSNDTVVVGLAFVGAALAVIAQAEAVPDLLRYGAAAIAAGCSAALALLRSPGQSPPVPMVPRAGAKPVGEATPRGRKPKDPKEPKP